MSKRDYVNVAKRCNAMLADDGLLHMKMTAQEVFDTLVSIMADAFVNDNDRFDKDKFMDAVYAERV